MTVPRSALAEHYGALVADFQAHYGLDLYGAEARMGAHRFTLLVSGLPPTSRFWSQVVPSEPSLTGEAAEQAFAAWS